MSNAKSKEDIVRELQDAIRELDEERLNQAVAAAIGAKVGFDEAVNVGLSNGLREVGDRFEEGELFLPHLVMAGDLMDKAVEKLARGLPQTGSGKRNAGTVVIGTVEGDVHEIGKNIVALMLRVGGFKVVDIGVDAPVASFIGAARENEADIVGASALLTTTQYEQKKLVEELHSQGLHAKHKVMVGGGQVTREWMRDIGADGYGKDAMEAVREAQKLMEQRTKSGGAR